MSLFSRTFDVTLLAALAATSFAAAPASAAGGLGYRPPAKPSAVGRARTASGGVINHLKHIVTIGSTVDPLNGDVNPYGLAIAPATSGNITAGDLVVCNFNDSFNIQGLGTTVEVLHPTPGSTPTRLIQDPRLTGCSALAMDGGDAPWIAAFTSNLNPIVGPTGTYFTGLNQFGWTQPWGQTYSPTTGPYGNGAFYESNADDGSIVRIDLAKNFTFETIATGFSVNHGVPGTVLAPAGLTYDAVADVLYIVDSNSNRLVAFSKPGTIPQGGIVVTASGFSGPNASQARVVYAGSPLAAPISSALLFNGNVVVGNTANNRLIEISPASNAVVGSKDLDRHAPGALFGIAASGTSVATTTIYFNDDNQNAVEALMP
jgi:hypothetical protein